MAGSGDLKLAHWALVLLHDVAMAGPAACDALAAAPPVPAVDDAPYLPGLPTDGGAQLSRQPLQAAAALTTAGTASALVTGPIAKSELAKVGFTFPGQTEFVADASGVAADMAVMMLAGPSLRTVPMTVHCALAEVPGRLSIDLICARARVVHRALQRDFGLANPRIAICGLNPHAGENGRMGREEIDIIAPAGDLLYANAYDILMEDVISGMYVGAGTVAGVRCHHLAFRGTQTDWQIWIEDGARPLPRKMVITSKWMTGAPQYTVTTSDWNMAPKLAAGRFKFVPPKDAVQLDFIAPAAAPALSRQSTAEGRK